MVVQTERRSKPRKRPQNLVYVELDSTNGGMMRDLSEEGFALRAMVPLRSDNKTAFHFSLDASTHISGEGKIVWLEEDGRVAGVKFTELSEESRKKIRAWLERPDDLTREDAAKNADSSRPSTLRELRQQARDLINGGPQETPPNPSVVNFPPQRPESTPASSRISELNSTEGKLAPGAQPPDSNPREWKPSETKLAERPHEPKIQSRSAHEPSRASVFPFPPPAAPPQATETWRRPTPSLEPLPSLEDSSASHWSDRFTFGRAVGLLLLLALLTAAYVYRHELGFVMIQAGQQISGSEQKASTESSAPAPASTSVPTSASRPAGKPVTKLPPPAASAPANSENKPAVTEDQETEQLATPRNETTLQTRPSPSPKSPIASVNSHTAPANSAPNPPVSQEPGQTEYLQALEILQRRNHRSAVWQAVRLLWLAVEKGNSDAEVALAEIYRVGDGVSKNCDQTRVLLSAAARKGNPEAIRRLHLFQRQGCVD